MKNFVYDFTKKRVTVYEKPSYVGIANKNTCKISKAREKALLELELLEVFIFLLFLTNELASSTQ